MIPSKSKKNLEATVEEIRKFSFSYLEKYAPSKQQLRIYLLKKFFKSSNFYVAKSELLTLIDLVISDLEKQILKMLREHPLSLEEILLTIKDRKINVLNLLTNSTPTLPSLDFSR